MLSLYNRLAPSPPLANFAGQKLTNIPYKISLARLEKLRVVLKFSASFLDCVTLNTLLRDLCNYLPVDATQYIESLNLQGFFTSRILHQLILSHVSVTTIFLPVSGVLCVNKN